LKAQEIDKEKEKSVLTEKGEKGGETGMFIGEKPD